jgi:hypothetical protein
MEHLVDTSERASQREEISATPLIPWLGFDHDTTTHPTVSIEEYPLRRGWTKREIHALELGETPVSRSLIETMSMIQSWLFFGLLESAFGTPFKTREYVRNIDGQVVMHTNKLRTCIDEYYTFISSVEIDDTVLQEQQEALVQSLKYAAAWNHRLADFSRFGNPLASNPEVFTHIARLTVLVGEAVWAVGQQFPSSETRFFIDCTWDLEPGHERELRDRVISRGWCPVLFDRMHNFARLPASFLEYMSIRPCLKAAPNRHQDCHNRCKEYNISNPKTYQAMHVQEGCDCENVRFPVQAIEDVFLDESAIPVVDCDELLKSSPGDVVKVWSPSSQIKFVTLSHVWSDGLGSDTDTGLPACQVKRLRDLTMKVSGTPCLWIDSLCIPRREDLRRKAISRMSESYRSSYATVVLDAGIKRCSTQESYQAQLLAVSLSTWQERLWTLSESVLSTRIFFAFDNELKDSKEFMDVSSTCLHNPVIRIGCTLLDNLSHGMYAKDVTIGALQRNLCRRTSTYGPDESLATATIMGLDLKPILELEGDERMMKFWSMAKHIPKGVIIESSAKFDADGFRWAPKSMMDLKCDVMMDFKDRSATVIDEGLCASFFLHHLRFPGTLTWSRTLTFYDTSTRHCLSLDRHDDTAEYALLPGDVICFPVRLNIAQTQLGAILRPLPHKAGNQLKFRYGILAKARLDRFRDMPGVEGVLGGLLMNAVGWMSSFVTWADQDYREIIIC